MLIDGGAGQLSAARAVLDDLGVSDVKLVAIAKGPDRDAGREWLHTDGMEPFQLPPRDPVLYFLQRIRDEAHRFAITTHRAGRSKAIRQSELDEVQGIGAARKRALLNHFGSARGVKMAGLGDLEAAPGINKEIARRVYAHFHPGVRMEGAVLTAPIGRNWNVHARPHRPGHRITTGDRTAGSSPCAAGRASIAVTPSQPVR